MGVTKIWAIKDSLSRVVNYAENPEKTQFSAVQQVLHYADDGSKVFFGPEKTMFVTTLHCRRDHAHEDMEYVKRYFNKTGGNLAYHCVQSFKTGEVSPHQLHHLRRDRNNAQAILDKTPERCRFMECELSLRQGLKSKEKTKQRQMQR